jgi:vancomycin permeability regulator SanA
MKRTKNNAKKATFLYGLTSVIVLAIWCFLYFDSFPGHRELYSWLLVERLISVDSLPNDLNELHSYPRKVIYVLGGSQQSLSYRFKTAVSLYRSSDIEKILILSNPSITGYDTLLGRNLTKDEWSVKRLKELGVQKRNVELLSLKYGFFGTLREAQGVSQEVSRRGYNVLILVSSPYHTARVRQCFSEYIKDKGIKMYVYGSDDYPFLWDLMYEYFKLIIYKNIL